MRNLRSIIFYSVIVLVLNPIIGDEIMPFGSLSEGIPGPPGPEGPPGPAGPGTFTEETKIIVADDYPTIQDAVDDAATGDVVFIPRGNYTVTQPILVTKNINVVGSGPFTQIFQSADEDLFVFTFLGGARIENMYLGSAATSQGKSLLRLDSNVSRSFFRNISMKGGYYGIYLNGTLENSFENLCCTGIPFFASSSCSINQYWVYGERTGGKSINGTVFYHPIIASSGTNGIWITDNHSEGGVHIVGGTIEGMPGVGLYLGGIQLCASVQGVHFEACLDDSIKIKSCNGVTISDIYSSNPIRIISSSNISITGGYISGNIYIDKFSKEISVTRSKTRVISDAAQVHVQGLKNVSNQWDAGFGLYTPFTHVRNLVDGDLESWGDGLPLGFTSWGTDAATQESTVVKFGKYSAKVQVAAGQTQAGLRANFDAPRMLRPYSTNYRSSDFQWTQSAGLNEYYVRTAAGGDPSISAKPYALLLGSSIASEGTVGSLSPGQWGYGDRDSLGYSTIYVRLSDNTDPDTKEIGYVEAVHKLNQLTASAWVYKPETNGVNPSIAMFYGSSTVQTSFTVPKDEWTKITAVFNLAPATNTFAVIFCTKYSGGSPGDLCYWDGLEIMEGSLSSPVYDDSRGLSGDLRVGGRLVTSTINTFSNGDSTPSVSSGNVFNTNNTVATTISMFDDGVAGQEIKVIFGDNNTTVDFTGTNLKGNSGIDWSPDPDDHITCVFDGTYWYCDVSDNT